MNQVRTNSGGIHLFIPMLHRRDAVGEHTRKFRQLLVEQGVASNIYVEHPVPETADETRPFLDYERNAAPGDVLVYQFATASAMAGWLISRPEPLVVNYHSLTPPQFFAPWNNDVANLQTGGQLELTGVARNAVLGIAVSDQDGLELRDAGCTETMVIPVVNMSDAPVAPDRSTLEEPQSRTAERRDTGTDGPAWLSVGRLAPNKIHHRTIAALFVARMTTDPCARLTLIGSPAEPHYASALRTYAARLGLTTAIDFVHGITDAELAAHYDVADVLVMLSDHEGFGVPLVEAMSHGLPVVAHRAGAVPDIVGPAGILLDDTSPRKVASAIHGLLSDPAERARRVERGFQRVGDLHVSDVGERLVAAVRQVADRAAGAVEFRS